MPHRATRDADLLRFGASDLDEVAQTFREIAAVAIEDGMAVASTLLIGLSDEFAHDPSRQVLWEHRNLAIFPL